MLPATSAQLSRNRGKTKTIIKELAKNPKKGQEVLSKKAKLWPLDWIKG